MKDRMTSRIEGCASSRLIAQESDLSEAKENEREREKGRRGRRERTEGRE